MTASTMGVIVDAPYALMAFTFLISALINILEMTDGMQQAKRSAVAFRGNLMIIKTFLFSFLRSFPFRFYLLAQNVSARGD